MKKLKIWWDTIDNWWYRNSSRDHNVCETDLVLPGGPGEGIYWPSNPLLGPHDELNALSAILEIIRVQAVHAEWRRLGRTLIWPLRVFYRLIRPRIIMITR